MVPATDREVVKRFRRRLRTVELAVPEIEHELWQARSSLQFAEERLGELRTELADLRAALDDTPLDNADASGG